MADPMAFAPLVAGSHRAAFRAVAVEGFQSGADPVGRDMPVTGGSVSLDGTAEILARASVTVADPWPEGSATQQLASEIFLARGVETGAGGILWAPLGYFPVWAADTVDSAGGQQTQFTLVDRMSNIVESRMVSPLVLARTDTVDDAVTLLVRDLYPAVQVVDPAGILPQTLGRQVVVERDRYPGLRDVAAARGTVVYFDELGRLVFDPLADDVEPVWNVNPGPGGVQMSNVKGISVERLYNGAVAAGEGTDEEPPIRVLVFDDTPGSPLRWGGPFGKRPRFLTSQLITDYGQAERAAIAMLRRYSGIQSTMDFTAVPNPAVRPWQRLRIRSRDGSTGIHILDQATIPMVSGAPLRGIVRQQVVHALATV